MQHMWWLESQCNQALQGRRMRGRIFQLKHLTGKNWPEKENPRHPTKEAAGVSGICCVLIPMHIQVVA